MLSRLLFFPKRFFAIQFNLKSFTREDYATMCSILRIKYYQNNEQIKTPKLIKLLDQNSKIIGIYSASQARKKAVNLGKDMILMNEKADPLICKIQNFRHQTTLDFYHKIVQSRKQKLISNAKQVRSLKVSPSLSSFEIKVKVKQIIEMSKRYLKLRVYTNCKEGFRDDALEKLELIKSQIQNKCFIQEDISNKSYESSKEEEQQRKGSSETYFFVIKSRDNQLKNQILKRMSEGPEAAVKSFLQLYKKQEDIDMMDLKDASFTIIEELFQDPSDKLKSSQPNRSMKDDYIIRQAEARILNERLKQILQEY